MTKITGKPFVAVWIAGGAGNQLFQFAAAYAVALRTGARLLLDKNFFSHPDKNRNYALHKLGIDAETWPWRTPALNFTMQNFSRSFVSGLRSKIHQWNQHYTVVAERQYDYVEPLTPSLQSIYIHGYWQSPKYFADVEASLKNVIKLDSLIAPDAPLTQAIRNKKSVAIHVRRGDYAIYHSDTFGLIPYSYYDYAASLLRDGAEKPHFFVFSDDSATARAMFGDWSDATICPTMSPEEDLALMSSCKHQIIANSTFSWWSAWLNANPDKIVIAPKAWATKKVLLLRYIFDLFPDKWLLL